MPIRVADTITPFGNFAVVQGRDASVDASSFSGNLSATDTTVQQALATIDALTLGGGIVTGVSVTGNVLTINYNDAMGVAQTIDFASGAAVARSIAVGWSADTTITTAELATTAMTDNVRIPDSATNQYLAFWASNDSGVVRSVNIGSGTDELNTFGTPTALTLNSEAGQLYVSSAQRSGTLLSGELMRVGFEAFAAPDPGYRIRAAISADRTLDATEIAAGTLGDAGSDRITIPTYSASSYIFLGVPDSSGDIESIRLNGQNEFGNSFGRIAGTIDDPDGVAYKWWATFVPFSTIISGSFFVIGQV